MQNSTAAQKVERTAENNLLSRRDETLGSCRKPASRRSRQRTALFSQAVTNIQLSEIQAPHRFSVLTGLTGADCPPRGLPRNPCSDAEDRPGAPEAPDPVDSPPRPD